MIIDLTYSCKMGCSHCMSDCKPEGKNMSIQVLKDSLDFLKKYQIPTWYFSGGEIFEHPDILKILEGYPCEVPLERKALSRIIHNITDSQLSVFSDKTGTWLEQEEK